MSRIYPRRTREEMDDFLQEQERLHSFEHIWEQDARWLTGVYILSTIAKFTEGKSLKATFVESTGSLNISIPFPTAKDEVSSQQIPIFYLIPDELKERFRSKCTDVVNWYRPALDRRLHWLYEGCPIDPQLLAQVNHELGTIERENISAREPSLAQNLAYQFGLLPDRRAPLYFLRTK
jgi:hypothetical protein